MWEERFILGCKAHFRPGVVEKKIWEGEVQSQKNWQRKGGEGFSRRTYGKNKSGTREAIAKRTGSGGREKKRNQRFNPLNMSPEGEGDEFGIKKDMKDPEIHGAGYKPKRGRGAKERGKGIAPILSLQPDQKVRFVQAGLEVFGICASNRGVGGREEEPRGGEPGKVKGH